MGVARFHDNKWPDMQISSQFHICWSSTSTTTKILKIPKEIRKIIFTMYIHVHFIIHFGETCWTKRVKKIQFPLVAHGFYVWTQELRHQISIPWWVSSWMRILPEMGAVRRWVWSPIIHFLRPFFSLQNQRPKVFSHYYCVGTPPHWKTAINSMGTLFCGELGLIIWATNSNL